MFNSLSDRFRDNLFSGSPKPGMGLSRFTTACAAVALPTLIAYDLAPSATFLNEVAAFAGWGAFLLVLAISLPPASRPRAPAAVALLGAVAVLVIAVLASSLWASAPWTLTLSAAGTLMMAALTLLVAGGLVRAGRGEAAFRAFAMAMVIAGVASALIGMVQVFEPAWAGPPWIAASGAAGRAIGNLRQPNHLTSLLLWSVVAAVWLMECKSFNRAMGSLLWLLFLIVIFLTGSRTGALGILVLATWGALDRRLSRWARLLLLVAPLVYGAMWGGGLLWSHAGGSAIGTATRAMGGEDFSSSRFAIWSNALHLIATHPWAGVGFGEFNFAWTLTPFPERPNEFFDHTHNFILNLAVELGLPLAAVVLGLLLWALGSALIQAVRAGRAPALPAAESARLPMGPPMQRAAFVMVAMVGLHSLLEYPLWYAYFLLPTAFAFGLCVERPTDEAVANAAANRGGEQTRPMVLAAMVMILGAALTMFDYLRVNAIFTSPREPSPLAERIEAGRRSVLFAHHADYAAVTVTEHPSEAMDAFQRAPHFLLDARLMIAWASALNERGDIERARYIAQRAKEFHNASEAAFFAPCNEPPKAPATSLPFQCTPPTRTFRFEDFR